MARDMTAKQFATACARQQFKPVMGGLWLLDLSVKNGTQFGGVLRADRGIHRRQSLKNAIKRREAERARAQRKAPTA